MYKKIRQHRHTGQYSVLMPILFTLLVSPFVHAIPDRTSGTVVIYTGFAASASPNAPADAGKTARIAQKQAENEPAPLPDLTVESLDGGATRTDAQTLLLSGTLTATVKNGGGAPAPANISLKAFFDINLNGTYEAGLDISLGDAFIENALAAAESTAIDIAVSGQMPFRDAPLTVWADSSQSVPESNEENNFSADSKHCVSSGGALEPVLKWERNGGRVAHAPITGPLLDTDENGVIDEHDTPAVIVLEGYSLAALDGKTGAVLWRNERSFRTYGVTPALGDIDGDGKPEIIAYLPERKVIVLNNDGTEKWISEAIFDEETVLALSGPAIADLDADGQAEIIAANIVLNADGSVKWAGSPTSTLTPIAVDLDKDGAPEVVTGRHVYRADGSLYWSFPN
ncbi:MAG: hypothetical protein GY862_35325, partial [Gammaproteobacteria bacterium]|nr:hypothetical protein [Gammaproteobacteria bacterium]